jgi:hypothetical protein
MSDALWFTVLTYALRLVSVMASLILEFWAFKLFSRRGRKESLAEGEIALWGKVRGKLKGIGAGLALALVGIALPILSFSWHPKLTIREEEITETVDQLPSPPQAAINKPSVIATPMANEKPKAPNASASRKDDQGKRDETGVNSDTPGNAPDDVKDYRKKRRKTTRDIMVSPDDRRIHTKKRSTPGADIPPQQPPNDGGWKDRPSER